MKKEELFYNKMKEKGIPNEVISLFINNYKKLSQGDFGIIRENDIQPVCYGELKSIKDIPKSTTTENLKKAVVIKLNGGLGTSMGLNAPKSLLPVKNGKSFLDIVLTQIDNLNKENGIKTPLILMNSEVTNSQTEEVLLQNSSIFSKDIPNSFIHHSHPKVRVKDLTPALYPQDTAKEWNPAGHGDIYISLYVSKILDKLINMGYEYAFISNIDNLGATFDRDILDYFANSKAPFLMEVVRRREMDKKGGHLAKDKNGNLILREKAQADEKDITYFEDINRYSYFNSNSIWINLQQLKEHIENSQIMLPFIANKKNINPTDKSSDEVYQIETAMGSAIALFDGAKAIEIENSRFKPVKKNNDLLLLWSDRYTLSDSGVLKKSNDITKDINIELDSNYFATYKDLEERVKQGIPSLKKCNSLNIIGNIYFGENVEIIGSVTIINKDKLPKTVSNIVINNDTVEL